MHQDVRDLKLFKHGNKVGKLLAHLTKEAYKPAVIPCIQDGKGDLQTEPEAINKISQDYNQMLYSPQSYDKARPDSFLNYIPLPTVTQAQLKRLNSNYSR